MRKYQITVLAAPIAGSGITTHEYRAEAAEQAVKDFWADVEAFGLDVSAVISVVGVLS